MNLIKKPTLNTDPIVIKAEDIIVRNRKELSARIGEFIEAGASKFILTPYIEPENWELELNCLAEETLHLQS